MADTHFYEPSQGHRLPRDPFKSIVAPRPIGWISTISVDGRVNLAPYSYFNALNDRPPMVMFSSYGPKDTLVNARATGEFVCNVCSRKHAEAMNRTALPLPHGEDEMALAGLTPAPCRLVKPPRVADAPAALECRVVSIINPSDLAGAATNVFVVIGQVVGVHIDPACLKDGFFDITAAGTIARCGYAEDYLEVTELFRLTRPTG